MMSNSEITNILARRKLNEAYRNDFKLFLQMAFFIIHGKKMSWNWHHDVICDVLIERYRGGKTRSIVNVPPRSLKSFICSVAFPAWVMGQNPRIKIIGVSYAQDLANKFSREQRQLMMSSWYRQVFPKTRINPKKASESEFELVGGGFRLATSTGGILTGRGADIIIIDDPVKPQDALSETTRKNANEWIDTTLMSRLDDKEKGIMVMIMQRLHEDDSTGYLLEKGGWEHYSFPSIALEDEAWTLSNGKTICRRKGELLHPAREGHKVLEGLKRDLGTMHFNAQYQQQPIPVEGNIVKEEWFSYYSSLPKEGRNVISIDSAMKDGALNDWSVCTVWRKVRENYYLVRVVRKKMDFPALYRCVLELCNEFGPSQILVEDVGSGTTLIQQLRSVGFYCKPCRPSGDKVERMAAASLAFEQSRVFLPENKPAWYADYIHELLAFPASKHDDQVDSTSQFLNWAINNQGGRIIVRSFK